jgi:hypothetical protein
MNLASFLNDSSIFSEALHLNNTEYKNQWIKYCRVIMPHSGYTIEYSHPFKSEKFKDITDYTIYNNSGRVICEERTHSIENAEAQAYIKISQISTFNGYYAPNVAKIEYLIDKSSPFRMVTDIHSKYYKIRRDLNSILNDTVLMREWKLSRLLKKVELV